jgi:S1-C subfamily serine protease
VTAVRPRSQAEKDGFKKADVISAMNEKAATEFSLAELRERLTHEGEKYQIGVTRGADKLRIPVQITLMSMDRN